MNRAAKTDDFLSDRRHNTFQAVGADMRLLVNENLFRCTVGNEGFQNVPDMGTLDPAGQFAI